LGLIARFSLAIALGFVTYAAFVMISHYGITRRAAKDVRLKQF
jgi:hypothetical protein